MADGPTQFAGPTHETSRPTVTLYGDHDAISQAIADELVLRGCRIHSVSIETGWLSTTTNAIVRLETAAGASALTALTGAAAGAHVVATFADPEHNPDSERLLRLCEECSVGNEISVLRHGPIAPVAEAAATADAEILSARRLALVVVDEVADQPPGPATSSLSTRAIAV